MGRNVVQIIIDSASSNMVASGMIEDEYLSSFWTPLHYTLHEPVA